VSVNTRQRTPMRENANASNAAPAGPSVSAAAGSARGTKNPVSIPTQRGRAADNADTA